MPAPRFTNDFIELYNRGTDAGRPSPAGACSTPRRPGTTWQATPLTGTIAPGALLPRAGGRRAPAAPRRCRRPNATGTIAMAATAGKVALVTDDDGADLRRDCDARRAACATSSATAAANDFEAAPAPALSQHDRGAARGDGGADTDNNAADFTAGAPNPRNTAAAAAADASRRADPADGATDVPLDSERRRSRSASPSTRRRARSRSPARRSGAHALHGQRRPDRRYTLDPAADFAATSEHVHGPRAATTDATTSTRRTCRLRDRSALDGPARSTTSRAPRTARRTRAGVVTGVPGVVTAVSTNGFWIQDPTPDADDAHVRGHVRLHAPRRGAGRRRGARQRHGPGVPARRRPDEPRRSPSSTGPTVTATGQRQRRSRRRVIGQGGRVPPAASSTTTRPATSRPTGIVRPAAGRDRLPREPRGHAASQFDDAVVVGPTNDFGEIPVVADNGRDAGLRTPRGGVHRRAPDDFNPERIILDDVHRPDTPTVERRRHVPGADRRRSSTTRSATSSTTR